MKAKIIEFLNKDFVKNYGKYILSGLLLVIFIIVFAIGALNGKNKGGAEDIVSDEGETGDVVILPSTDESQSLEGEKVADTFVSGEYPFIDELVNSYYTALANNDVDALSRVVDTIDAIPLEQLSLESQYIESYNNIECYVKEGLLDNTYIVLVYYEIKFLNVDTLAPGSTCLYVETDESGNPYIYTQALSDEVRAYRDLMLDDEFVDTLHSTTELKLQEAMSQDELLNELYSIINAEQETEAETLPEENTSEAVSETEAGQAETPAETASN